jgi:hypothetical protein
MSQDRSHKRVFDRMRPKKDGSAEQLRRAPSHAPVVLLYLSPGFGIQDLRDARAMMVIVATCMIP